MPRSIDEVLEFCKEEELYNVDFSGYIPPYKEGMVDAYRNVINFIENEE